MAAADKDGDLMLFYSYPGSDWKAVNVSEKTNAKIAVVWTESWIFAEGQIVLERLAAPFPLGDLLVFTWQAGSDWTVTNLSTKAGKKITGPVTSWNTTLGNSMVEHIGARGSDNHYVFHRPANGTWKVVDVTNHTNRMITHTPTSWVTPKSSNPTENLAAPSWDGHMHIFSFEPTTGWMAGTLHITNGRANLKTSLPST